MNKILITSHTYFGKRNEKDSGILIGQNENVETLCAYVDGSNLRIFRQW